MKRKLLILTILLLLITAGCVIRFDGGREAQIKGVFKSFDKGDNWIAKNLFLHSGGVGSIAGIDVISLTFDPQDNQAIYLASAGDGLLYSYDSGESWQKAKGVAGRVEAVAIDPKNKCIIYAALGSGVLKSVDCTRSWSEVYTDTRADKAAVTSLVIDHFNNLTIYAGNAVGEILKSTNAGLSWQVISRLEDRITKILIDPADSRILYVATKNKGIFKTTDSGVNWSNISDGLKPYTGAFEYRNLIFDLSQPNSLLLVSKYGLIKTDDGGKSWQPLNLITPPATTDIYAVAINPKNNREIYYATASTFYKTTDGGQNWITKRLSTLGLPAILLINPDDPKVIYLGVTISPNR